MEKSFSRNIGSLDDVFEYVEGFISLNSLGDALAFALKFSVEELFTNMVKYNPNGQSDISVRLEIRGDILVVQMIDHELVPFDIRESDVTDVTLPSEQREPGRLGVYLAKRMADTVGFEREGTRSTTTLTFTMRK